MTTNFFSWAKVLILLALLVGFTSKTIVADLASQFNEQVLPFDNAAETIQAAPFPDDPAFDRYVDFAGYIQSFNNADANRLAEYAIVATRMENILLRGRKDLDNDALWTIAARMAIITNNSQALENLSSAAKAYGKERFDKEIEEALTLVSRNKSEGGINEMIAFSLFSDSFYAIPAFFSKDMSVCFQPENNIHAALQEDKKGFSENLYKEWSKGFKNLADYVAKKPLSKKDLEVLDRMQMSIASDFPTRLIGEERGNARQLLAGRWETDYGRRAVLNDEGDYTAYTPVGWNSFTYQFYPYTNVSGHLRIFDLQGNVTGNFSVSFHGNDCMVWSGEGEQRIYHRR